jgi:hypothetical protein
MQILPEGRIWRRYKSIMVVQSTRMRVKKKDAWNKRDLRSGRHLLEYGASCEEFWRLVKDGKRKKAVFLEDRGMITVVWGDANCVAEALLRVLMDGGEGCKELWREFDVYQAYARGAGYKGRLFPMRVQTFETVWPTKISVLPDGCERGDIAIG